MQEKRCLIMRGASGAGKDRWINLNAPLYATIISADNFFVNEGVYKFDRDLLPKVHDYCLVEFLHAVDRRDQTIIVNNTNTKLWEIAPYYRVAEAHGYAVEIIWLVATASACEMRTQHGTPLEVIQTMITGVDALPPWWKVRLVLNEGQACPTW